MRSQTFRPKIQTPVRKGGAIDDRGQSCRTVCSPGRHAFDLVLVSKFSFFLIDSWLLGVSAAKAPTVNMDSSEMASMMSDMGGMGMDSSDGGMFVAYNQFLARTYWYIVAAVVGCACLFKGLNVLEVSNRSVISPLMFSVFTCLVLFQHDVLHKRWRGVLTVVLSDV